MNSKAASERYQRQVQELAKAPGNNQCADCNGRFPRWASWNLGIFLCVNCAGVHRKMGTHISKVKSLTLDTWSKEQVEKMRSIGNIESNQRFNPDERRNRPPANVEEGERNSELERFIFDKYRGRFMDSKPPPVPVKDEWRISPNPTGLGTPSTVDRQAGRSQTMPVPTTWADAQKARSVSPLPDRPVQPPPPSGIATTSSAAAPSLPDRPVPPTLASVPPRASSTSIQIPNATSQSNGQHSTVNGGASANGQSAPLAANTTPQSSVFDDLLTLQQSPAVQAVPSVQLSSHPYATMGASPMAMPQAGTHFGTSMGQPSPIHSPYGAAGFAGAQQQQRSVSLGAMAFTPTGMMPGQPSPGLLSPQAMGQQAFGMNLPPASPGLMGMSTSPYGMPAGAMGYAHGQAAMAHSPAVPSPTNPFFGNFAHTMMPNGQQQAMPMPQQPGYGGAYGQAPAPGQNYAWQ